MKKCVLVTGASCGLGRETALLFAKNNYNVIINYNSHEKEAVDLKNEIESNYKVKSYIYKCDISNEEDVKKMFENIKNEIGDITCLVNNAGIAIDNDLENKDSKEFMKVIEVNLLGTYLVSKYVSLVLKKGSIVNVSSTNGIDTNYVESIDYDASKAGVISLTHNFAKVYAPNIRVNAVAPGWIDTSMNKNLSPVFKKEEENKIMLERFAEAIEVAKVILFLASDDASYINDTIVRVDGGIK